MNRLFRKYKRNITLIALITIFCMFFPYIVTILNMEKNGVKNMKKIITIQ